MKRLLLAFVLACFVLSAAEAPACSKSTISSTTSSGYTQIVTTGSPKQSVRICAVYMEVNQGATATNFGMASGTGTACGTSTTAITPLWTGIAGAIQTYGQVVANNTAWYATMGHNVCLRLTSAPTGASVQVFYDLY
jgi:hypothetical protein